MPMRAGRAFLGVFADLSAKLRKILEFLKHFRLKYLVLSVIALAIAHVVLVSATPRPLSDEVLAQARKSDSLAPAIAPSTQDSARQLSQEAVRRSRRSSTTRRLSDAAQAPKSDSVVGADSLSGLRISQPDTTARKGGGSMIDQIITGKNTDSLFYDVLNKKVYIYNKGDVKYENMGLQADYMQIDMATKEIYAYGKADSVDGKPTNTHPVFNEGCPMLTHVSV